VDKEYNFGEFLECWESYGNERCYPENVKK
jgi:hypothetical protein